MLVNLSTSALRLRSVSFVKNTNRKLLSFNFRTASIDPKIGLLIPDSYRTPVMSIIKFLIDIFFTNFEVFQNSKNTSKQKKKTKKR